MNELNSFENGLSIQVINAIKNTAVDFSNVSQEEITELIKNYARQKRQTAFNTKFELSGIDYKNEKEVFLNTFKSEATKKAYRRALKTLEVYSHKINIPVLELTPANADNFIYSMSEISVPYIRVTIAGSSSFFSFLERRYEAIKNPFRGTRARPKKNTQKETEYPDAEELLKILQKIEDPILNTIIFIMAYSGLRVGAFANLTIKDGRFRTTSKGKEYKGRFNAETLERIRRNGLNLYKPFENYLASLCGRSDASETQKTETLKNKVFYELRKLYRAGIVKASYSAHDFRHFYAVTEYRKDKDIYRVSKALNHSSIQITEIYLKGLNEIQ